jgi:hypothetical protein
MRQRHHTTPHHAPGASRPHRCRVDGILEGVADGRVQGWAFDPWAPSRRVGVTLVGDDGRTMETVADAYRGDLFRAGIGDGHAGLAASLGRFAGCTLLRAYADTGGRELGGSPLRLAPPASAPRTRRAGPWLVALDPARWPSPLVSGWAVHLEDPSRRCRIGLRQRGRLLAETRATLHRGDCLRPGGDALHGFAFRIEPGPAQGGRFDLIDMDAGGVLARLARRR